LNDLEPRPDGIVLRIGRSKTDTTPPATRQTSEPGWSKVKARQELARGEDLDTEVVGRV
jgi:hypothetical protein